MDLSALTVAKLKCKNFPEEYMRARETSLKKSETRETVSASRLIMHAAPCSRVSATSIAHTCVSRVHCLIEIVQTLSIMVLGVYTAIYIVYGVSTFRIVLNKTDRADVESIIGAAIRGLLCSRLLNCCLSAQ